MKVLIVDDSVVFRSQIKAALENQPGIEVSGVAQNGKIALQKLEQSPVDLITLDMEMPELNGLETLKEIRKRKLDVKVIFFSSFTTKGSEVTLEALSNGADDFVPKPVGDKANFSSASDQIKRDLIPKILQFQRRRATAKGAVTDTEFGPTPAAKKIASTSSFPKKDLSFFKPKIVLIGSSTGGPPALEVALAELRPPLRCPILIAQHMPPVFTATLAKRIQSNTGIECKEARHLETLENKIYIAPGDFHMYVRKLNGQEVLTLDQAPVRNSVRPAVDHTFESAVKLYGAQSMAFILTGMGEDGLDGCKAVKDSSGGVMIQNKESCVVFGMPGAVFDAKLFDEMGDLKKIGKRLVEMAQGLGHGRIDEDIAS